MQSRGLHRRNKTNAYTKAIIYASWFEGPGYGIRAGQSSGSPANATLEIYNGVLIDKSKCTAAELGDPDNALVIRGDAPKNITISGSVIRTPIQEAMQSLT